MVHKNYMMLTNLSVDQVLKKAKSHVKKGELLEAQKLYKSILKVFSKNVRAQQGLSEIMKTEKNDFNYNYYNELLNKLVQFYNQGNFLFVVEMAESLSKQFPKSLIVWNLLGVSAVQIGMQDKAINAFQKALSLNPNNAEVYNNMGIAFRDKGMLNEAIEAYNKAISIKYNYAEAYYNKGIATQDQNKQEVAIEAYRKAIYFNPNYASAYSNMGNILRDQGKLDEAIDSYNKAISLKPNYAPPYSNLGNALKDLGKLKEAVEKHKKSISLEPNNPVAFNNMGIALKEQGNLDEAITAYRNALLLKPDYANPYSNMGNALKDQDKLDEALEAFKQALLIEPNHAEAYNNIGITFQDLGKSENSIKAYKRSISLKPDYAEAHENLSYALLNYGRLKEGLDEYEWRCKTAKGIARQRNFLQPTWDGEKSLKGKKILFWSEQGIGDTINWCSYLPFIINQADKCILECQEKVVPLLQRSFPNISVKHINRSLDSQRDDFDFHLPMGSLCRHFMKEISNNNLRPHLIAEPSKVKFWKKRLKSIGSGPYIGISWKSSKISPNRMKNYSSISEWSPIFKIPNITFINLQSKDFKDDLNKIKKELGVDVYNFDDLDHFNNIDDVAALCKALDIVVSTKTTVPLISAGVGTTTKLANWRQSAWNNLLYNPNNSFVDIFERNTWESWDKVFSLIARDIIKK